MKTKVALSLAAVLCGAALAAAQDDPGYTYIRFHRVHLRNGNCVEGDMIAKTERQVTLKLRGGEMMIRNDQIDRVEFVKMKSYKDPEILVPKGVGSARPATGAVQPPPKREVPPSGLELRDSAEAAPLEITQTTINSVEQTIALWKSSGGQGLDLARALIDLGQGVASYLEFLIEKRSRSTPLEPVAQALAGLSEDRFIDLSVRLLSSSHGVLREAAVSGLVKATSSRRLPLLLDAMEDSDPSVWRRAGEALIASAKDEAEKRDLAEMVAARIRNSKNTHGLSVVLGKIGGRTASQALWDLINDSSEANRLVGIQGIAAISDPEEGPRVAGLLRDSSQTIRKAACLAIGKMRYALAVGDLVGLLSEDNQGLQKNARWALLEITGQPLGESSDAWKGWWQSSGSKEPRFNPQ